MNKTILVLAANPKYTQPLRLDEEIREIENGLERAHLRGEFTLIPKLAVRYIDLRRAMLDYKPNIVHFCGHGSEKDGIAFEDESGQTKFINADALSEFFELFADHVECVVLNACYSEVQAEAIAVHIKYVVGVKKTIGDKAAKEFAVAFYDSLGAGYTFEFAHKMACNALKANNLPKDLLPVLVMKRNNSFDEQAKNKVQDAPTDSLRLSENLKPLKYDVFIAHAWEDREIAEKLSQALQREGLEVWFSGFQLRPGDHLRRSIDRGLIESRYGLVIFSHDFLNLAKFWTQYEFDALIQREVAEGGKKAIIPIWFNLTVSEIRSVSLALADRIAIIWNDDLQSIVRQILSVLRPVTKSQRRATLERQMFDRLYHFGDAISPALRLVGAETEFFTAKDVLVSTRNEPYLLPSKYRNNRDALLENLLEEAASNHKVIYNGPATRLLSYQIIVPDPVTERKALRLILGPLNYFDYAIARRLSDAALEDDGIDHIDEFINVVDISAGKDFLSKTESLPKINTLSNIIDTATTVISNDGYLFYVERAKQVSDRTDWYTSAIAENIQAVMDEVDFSKNDWVLGLPFRTVKRGVKEELSPKLKELIDSIGWKNHLRMLGISFDLEGFHPDLLFLLVLPLPRDEIRRLCRDFPGKDANIEGKLRSADIREGGYDIVRKLATSQWTPGGAASVIRSLEYLSSVSRECHLQSLQEAIDWILSEKSL